MIKFIGNSLIDYENIEFSTMQECIEYLSKQDVIGLDIETSRKFKKGTYREDVYKPGLDPYVSNICMIQIGTVDVQYVIDARVIDCRPLKVILEDETILKVLHNAKFEGKFFKNKYNIHIKNVWDTMLSERVLYNGYLHSYSLAALMKRYLGIKSKDSIDLFSLRDYREEDVDMYVDKSTRLQFINWGDKPFTVEQILYGADDIIAPIKIYHIQKRGREVSGKNWNPTKAFRLENKFTQVLAYTELVGMPFNPSQWLEVYEKNKKIFHKRLNVLDTYVIKNYPKFASDINLFSNTPECNIQWSSSKQVIAFFRYLNICPKEKSNQTGKLEWTVGAKAVFKLLDNEHKMNFYEEKFPDTISSVNDFIVAYLLFKKTEQLVTTFGKDFLRYVHPVTKRIHSSYNQFMNTGRLSSTNPNLQNIPGNTEFRNCFSNGEYYINADFSGQESVCLASVSQVPSLVSFYKDGHSVFGTDLHSYAATNMYRALLNDPDLIITKKTDKEKRNNAKAFNFKLALIGI